MDRLLALGERHGIPVIEDAAEAIGSQYYGRRAGSMGRFGAFSFHGTKTITTGEGGMFVTSDADLYERVLTLSNHGRARSQTKQFWPDMVGFKFKMSNVQAAMGCAQLERIDDLVSRKRAIFHAYRDRLSDLPMVRMNPDDGNIVNGAWMPTVVFDKDSAVTRERMQAAFKDENIDARGFFHPLKPEPGNVNAWDIPGRSINLPSFHDMTDGEQDRAVGVVRNLASAKS